MQGGLLQVNYVSRVMLKMKEHYVKRVAGMLITMSKGVYTHVRHTSTNIASPITGTY